MLGREETRARRWRFALLSIGVILGLLHAWLSRNTMHPDGISYLDLADAFTRGDWRTATNALWSPLYPALIGVFLALLRPPASGEFAAVHLVNFLLYLAALGAFYFLMRQILMRQGLHTARLRPEGLSPLPEWALWALGLAVFLWISLDLITLETVTPDMAVAAFVFLASGLVLHIRQQPGRWLPHILLGGVLGAGYLAKAPMLPLALVYLGLAGLATLPAADRGHRWTLSLRPLAAVAALIIVVTPFVVALSTKAGHFSVGESGRLNYAWWVNSVPALHWRGDPPGSGSPRHPTRRILDRPPVYEFASPIVATYPPWFDPAYWMEGLTPRFDLGGHLRILALSLRTLYRVFFQGEAGLIAGALILIYLCPRQSLQTLAKAGIVLLTPALAGLALFSFIHLEPRFVGAFVALFWLGIFVAITLPESRPARRLAEGATLAMVALLMVPLLLRTGSAYSFARQGHTHLKVATGLQEMGLRSGDRVAVIGFTFGAYWARLGRFRIAAETSELTERAFLTAADPVKRAVLSAFAGTGARAAVVRSGISPGPGWQRIGDTDYFAYLF